MGKKKKGGNAPGGKLLRPFYSSVDTYPFNSAFIRVRVIDPLFEGKTLEERDAMVEQYLKKLPKDIQREIMVFLTLAPNEMNQSRISPAAWRMR